MVTGGKGKKAKRPWGKRGVELSDLEVCEMKVGKTEKHQRLRS